MNTTEPGSAPSCAAHDLAAGALGPQLELVGCRGTERVGRGEDDALPVGDLLGGELADGGGLADAVDADEHPHVDLAGDCVEHSIGILSEDARHLVTQQAEQRVGVGHVFDLGSVAHRTQQPLRRRHADIGEEQRFFELVPGVVVDLVPADRAQVAGERGAGPAEPIAQPRLDDLFGLDDDIGLVDDDDVVDDDLVDRGPSSSTGRRLRARVVEARRSRRFAGNVSVFELPVPPSDSGTR